MDSMKNTGAGQKKCYVAVLPFSVYRGCQNIAPPALTEACTKTHIYQILDPTTNFPDFLFPVELYALLSIFLWQNKKNKPSHREVSARVCFQLGCLFVFDTHKGLNLTIQTPEAAKA
jgi:hypothetical protein